MSDEKPLAKADEKPNVKDVQKDAQEEQRRDKKEGTKNEVAHWDALQQSWTKEQAQRAQAYALRYFDTDEDLTLSQHMLFLFIVLFFVFFVIWASFASLDEVTRGEGKVIPSSELQTLQSLDAGIVQEFLVLEGDKVEEGQILMRLSDIEASADLGANRARFTGLLASVARLKAEAQGLDAVAFPEDAIRQDPGSVEEERRTFKANKSQLRNQTDVIRQQLSQKEQEVTELEGRIRDTRSVMELQKEEMSLIEPLVERGSAPRMELLQLEKTFKERETELNSLLSSLPRAKSAIEEFRARLSDIEVTARAEAQAELAARQIELNEIRERLSALTERKTRTEIKSPVNGTIQELTVNTIGGVVSPGADLIKIVPSDDRLVVEAKIRPADIAFLYPGQKALVKITAYDFSIYGALQAELVSISADTVQDEQGHSFYRVRLHTSEPELRHHGRVLPIIPGMVASVDILTGRKR